jgi:hypothetical protein
MAHLSQYHPMKLRSMTARGAIASGLIAAFTAVPYLPVVIMAIGFLLASLVFFGVIMPAVWSSKLARRKAAAAILGQILGTLRRHW